MMKHLSIAAALVFAVACKTDAPSPTSAAPAGEDTTKPRSAKIDVKPVQPALPPAETAAPAAPAEPPRANAPPRDMPPGSPDREDWRRRRDAKVDANGDGVVSDEERAAANHERVVNIRTRFDADGDGKLTLDELAKARGRIRFDDPAAVDTNHDGDISAEELDAALKARRDQRRGDRRNPDR